MIEIIASGSGLLENRKIPWLVRVRAVSERKPQETVCFR